MTGSHMLYLMRHGAPTREGLLLGRTDASVTVQGIAACLARAATLDVARIVTSDLARTRDCARAIAASRAIEVDVDPRWRELDFGAWDGLEPAEVDPTALAQFYDDPDAAPPPGGERWSALQGRVHDALADVPPAATLIVTHGGAIRAALADLCGFDRRQIWAFDLPYASLVSLRIWPGDERTVQIVGLAT
ncbi:histidine phosphatase family protein [Sphingomonas sp. CFBP 13603]|uniref:histidine phosphatase family protein n=1 Tax=Sphingomonas sp. CFBP 13603 TaxID=2774040 RepID=UPI00406C95AE